MVDNKKKAEAMVEIIDGICKSVQAAGPNGIPCGTLYAVLMPHGCSLDTWNMIERILIGSGKIVKKSNALIAL